jgi:glycosyltransferase involved in cell wall biosynthesis
MIKVAFVKFGGMSIGGTEKVLQTIASLLPKDRFQVDYYYTNGAPYIGSSHKHLDTEPSRVEFCKRHGVNCIPVRVGFKNVTVPTHDWVDTDFWDLFDESSYDLVVSGRSGHPEYPFHLIRKTPVIDTIHLSGMAENKSNTYRTVLISKEQRERWVAAGGPREKSTIIPNPVYIPNITKRIELDGGFVFGMHQRNNDNIFSPIPLQAYQKIESDDTLFVMIGGSRRYREQADALNIQNIKFVPTTSDVNVIHEYLDSFNVYAHGRSDGEQCSTAIIEAMSHGLPVISHTAPSMGHLEQIGNAGAVVGSVEEYVSVMNRMMNDEEYFKTCSNNSIKRFNENYSVDSIINRYANLFEEAVK